ncbi:hypothetical protein AMP2_gp084 [Pseudomonas phage vB_Pae_AM.P2]|uniref:Uncharacterized protein n=1 Tax=Pseudomonas phage vB_Pae_AM.P2 TaxID=2731695 RepID=A0A7S6B6E8_9CAUD|nr:hypothetical protein AMP2_gp084 [Pseudomonas phage vB_Pae_AM.P2]
MQDSNLVIVQQLKARLSLLGVVDRDSWHFFDSTDFFFKELPGAETMEKVHLALDLDYIFNAEVDSHGVRCSN